MDDVRTVALRLLKMDHPTIASDTVAVKKDVDNLAAWCLEQLDRSSEPEQLERVFLPVTDLRSTDEPRTAAELGEPLPPGETDARI